MLLLCKLHFKWCASSLKIPVLSNFYLLLLPETPRIPQIERVAYLPLPYSREEEKETFQKTAMYSCKTVTLNRDPGDSHCIKMTQHIFTSKLRSSALLECISPTLDYPDELLQQNRLLDLHLSLQFIYPLDDLTK